MRPKSPRSARNLRPDPKAFLERYRTKLAALTAECHLEIDALFGDLSRHDRAIAEIHRRPDAWHMA